MVWWLHSTTIYLLAAPAIVSGMDDHLCGGKASPIFSGSASPSIYSSGDSLILTNPIWEADNQFMVSCSLWQLISRQKSNPQSAKTHLGLSTYIEEVKPHVFLNRVQVDFVLSTACCSYCSSSLRHSIKLQSPSFKHGNMTGNKVAHTKNEGWIHEKSLPTKGKPIGAFLDLQLEDTSRKVLWIFALSSNRGPIHHSAARDP